MMNAQRTWAEPKLAYIYVLAEALAETMPEDSPQETALRLAMSKIDEADMATRKWAERQFNKTESASGY